MHKCEGLMRCAWCHDIMLNGAMNFNSREWAKANLLSTQDAVCTSAIVGSEPYSRACLDALPTGVLCPQPTVSGSIVLLP